jgi:translocation and assembly module TamB
VRRRWLKILLAVPVLLLVMALGAWLILWHTTSGARLLLDVAQPYIPGRLEFTSMDGSLSGGLRFKGLIYDDEAARVEAGDLRVAVSGEFRPIVLRIRFLEIAGLRYVARESDESGPMPESLALPFRIDVERLEIDGLAMIGAGGEPVFEADQLRAALSAHERLDVSDGLVQSKLGRLTAAGNLLLSTPYAVELTSEASLSFELEELPEAMHVDGQVRLGGSMGAYVVDFDGAARSGELDVQTSGRFDLADRAVTGDLDWTGFTWPPDAAEPGLSSPVGSVTLAGTFDNWTVRGEADVESPDLPAGTLVFDASGDRERLSARIIEGRFLGGVLAGQAAFSWAGERPFEIDLRADRVATGPLYPDLPAVISGDFAAQGTLQPLVLAVDIGQVRGEVRGYDLSVGGHASYRLGELAFRALDVRAGDSRLRLDGSLDRPDGVAFDADIRDLGHFIPEASGRLEARGNLALRERRPRLNLSLKGNGLAWGDILLPAVSVTDRPASLPESLAALTIELQSPAFSERMLEAMLLEIDFAEDRQDVAVALENAGNSASVRLSGAVADLDAPLADWRWTGRLSALELAAEGDVLVTLDQPAVAEFTSSLARVETACMRAGRESRLCLDAAWSRQEGVKAKAVLEDSPLSLLRPFLGQDVEFTQQARGELAFEMDPTGEYSGVADIQLSPGMLRYPGDPEPILQTGPGIVGFRLVNGGLEAGNLSIPLPGQGEVDLDFRVPDLSEGMDSELSGRLRISMNDLDLLSAFLPMADEISGRLEADLRLAGTAERPYSTGHVALSDGVIANRTSGLRLNEIQLAGQMDGEGLTEMKGSFRATEGSGSLEALIDLTDVLAPRVTLGIQGSGLKLFDSQVLTVVAEPDLGLEWKSGAMHVDGRITIPSARVAPAVLPAPTVTESEDVRIVAGELPDAEPPGRKKSRLSVFGNLELVLGEQVIVDIDVAEVGVSGRARFEWEGGLVPRANGSYNTRGEILALGQLLEITEGRVLFPNVPANDPHLNIQAEREIFGNSEIRRAGLLITGTLRRPLIEPYTEPMTNRERARTLLITGSDFNMERGTGAVNIGTYIAPRIFVSYGLGLFENENVISVRYDLGRGWGVKATSGESQTGVDISYTVDQ